MKISYMNPDAHDKHIAYVSHLSHLSSFMLGKTVMDEEKNEKNIFDMAGSGFESTVRLAKVLQKCGLIYSRIIKKILLNP